MVLLEGIKLHKPLPLPSICRQAAHKLIADPAKFILIKKQKATETDADDMIPAPYGGTKEKRQFDRPPRIARKSVSNFKSFFQTGSLRSIGESCSSFCSASLQNLSAVRGLHSLTEAVLFLSLTLLGLICSQHADTSFKKIVVCNILLIIRYFY